MPEEEVDSPLSAAKDDEDPIARVFDAPDPRKLSPLDDDILTRELQKRRVRFVLEEAEKEAKKARRAKKAPKSDAELAKEGESSEDEEGEA